MDDRRGRFASTEEEVWTVDAGATLQSLLDDPACPALLRRALNAIQSWQVRNETIVRRTLKASSVMPNWMAALLALGAVVTVEGDGGDEEVDLEALIQREVKGAIKTLHVPRRAGARWGEAHVARTPSDDPIVAAFAVVSSRDGVVEEARIALTGVSSAPVWLADTSDALPGRVLDDGPTGDGAIPPRWIEHVASAVQDQVRPQGDYLGSEEYRRAMAGVLTRRALQACGSGAPRRAALPKAGGGHE